MRVCVCAISWKSERISSNVNALGWLAGRQAVLRWYTGCGGGGSNDGGNSDANVGVLCVLKLPIHHVILIVQKLWVGRPFTFYILHISTHFWHT